MGFTLFCLQGLVGPSQLDYDSVRLYVCVSDTYLCGHTARSHLEVNIPAYMHMFAHVRAHTARKELCASRTSDNVPTNRTPEGTVCTPSHSKTTLLSNKILDLNLHKTLKELLLLLKVSPS